ncbi:PilW family protein [Xanthomonas campestris]|uniref:PilW family protein n=1 Tax=Xanthomonas campestris TaxID=339 RepID=UPI000E328695|nr:PilW family protein [Xanthomonas campestris]MEA9559361.1 PilW family protein [Xanthomonas campestris]MEA9722272.1 PilW family protein [Xanthomonas campestris]MEA9807646.1 PilW family protein [Xanthomonas campestris pv. raphani]MEB1884523.1 PilW family protein [Xanthomonas campestris pv. campestris]RFF51632.1 prepilin-type N-terminal cleavage/methylation domain-containing protein [Xanthomonas campestris]
MKNACFRFPAARQQGFNLIELMISMLLGLLVVGAAIGIFLSNRQTYAATEGLGRVQETARIGFEMLARDIRESGANPCDKALPVANVLTSPTATWWKNWVQPLQGFENGVLSGSASGTDAIQILAAATGGATLSTHAAASQQITLSATAPEIQSGNLALLCDRQQLAILQLQTVSGTSVSYVSASLNTCNRLGRLPGVCVTGSNAYTYERNAILTNLRAVRWYVKANSRGSTSLYQDVIGSGGTSVTNEIAEGVSDMELEYLTAAGGALADATYVNAAAITNWANVLAVRLSLTVQSPDSVGSDGQPLSRTVTSVISIRNRNS